MKQTLAILIPSIFLLFYTLLSSIQFGASIFLLFPKLLKKPKIIYPYINPIWETTSLLPILLITSVITFFPSAATNLGTNLTVPIYSALTFIIIRSICVFIIYYSKYTAKPIFIHLLITSFAAPMIFASSFTYILTGNTINLFHSPLTFAFFAIVASSILTLSTTFFQFLENQQTDLQTSTPNKHLNILIYISTFLLIASVDALINISSKTSPHLYTKPTPVMLFAISSIITLFTFAYTHFHKHYLLRFLSIYAFIITTFFSFLAFAFPYLIYPDVTIANSIIPDTLQNILFIVFGTILIMLIILTRLFYTISSKPHSTTNPPDSSPSPIQSLPSPLRTSQSFSHLPHTPNQPHQQQQ